MYSQSPCTPINEKVSPLFFDPKYLDLESLSKNFPKNDSFPAFQGIVS